MTRRAWGAALLLAVGGLGMLGCTGGKPPLTHFYTLGVSPGQEVQEGEGADVLVRPFAVDVPYDQDRLVYREAPGSAEIGYYNYHRWASPLGRLVAVAVAGGLEGARGVGVVEPTSTQPSYDAVLNGRVIRIEEVGTGAGVTVRVAIDFHLVDGSVGEPLWSGLLSSEASGPAADGARSMELAQAAFAEILEQLRAEVSAALETLNAEAAG